MLFLINNDILKSIFSNFCKNLNNLIFNKLSCIFVFLNKLNMEKYIDINKEKSIEENKSDLKIL